MLLQSAESSQLLTSDLSQMADRAIRSSPTIFLNGQRYTGPLTAPAKLMAGNRTTTGLSCTTNATCDDGSACTTDACVNNVCVNTPITCNDNNACTTDKCDPILGCTLTPINVNDNNACTIDACNPQSGVTHTPITCDDHNACTTDSCDPVLGCVSIPITPTTSNAGPSQTIVSGTTPTLAANTPTTGTGSWSVASGPSTNVAQLSNRTNPGATFTPAGGIGQYVLVWTVSNLPCASSSSSMTLTVKPANTPPVATPNANQTATVGLPFSYTVNAFTDAETPSSLTYTASITPVNGLHFNGDTHVLSGTPVSSGVNRITIIVVDPGGLTARTSFTVTGSDIITSIQTGNWESASTWNLNGVPAQNDQVIIDQNHTVTLSGTGKAKSLMERSNAKLKLAGTTPAFNWACKRIRELRWRPTGPATYRLDTSWMRAEQPH